jgi:rhodanese-related sulfurtransferase
VYAGCSFAVNEKYAGNGTSDFLQPGCVTEQPVPDSDQCRTQPSRCSTPTRRTSRAREGVIPGAVLLSSDNEYDVAKELPPRKDARLVFYCASIHCLASHAAARRAVEAGYTNVSVMVDGLKGWKAAGEPIDQPRA